MSNKRSRLVYGLHAAQTVLERRADDVLSAMLIDSAARRLDPVAARLEALGINVIQQSRAQLNRLCDGGRHQGIVLEVRQRGEFSMHELEELVLARERTIRLLVLDQVEDPRNLGACLRTADATAVDAVIVPKANSAKLTGAALKAATGAAETVPVAVVPNLARMLTWLKQAGVWVVGADASAPTSLHEAKLAPPIAMVLGAEGHGLRRLTRETCDELVHIPMHGSVESLNVSVAAGVMLYELARQAPPGSPNA